MAFILQTSFLLMLMTTLSLSQDCNRPPPMGTNCCSPMLQFMTRESAVKCGLPAEMADGPPGPGAAGGRGGPGGPGGAGGPTCSQTVCILKEKNLLNAANEIDLNMFKTYVNQQFGPEWKLAIDKTIQTCSASSTGGSSECNTRKFVHCAMKNMFLNCPDSVWVSNSECNDLKNYIRTCPPPPGMD